MAEAVAVVTPSLNQSHLLRECLLAVSGQAYAEVEHIVVDGGSSDETLRMLAGWASTPARRYVSEPDRGMYDALNKGFRLAKGELFAYLNCDDLYLPHSLEVLIEGRKESGADVVYGDMVRLYDDGRVVFKLQPSWDSGFYGRYYQLAQPSTLWTRELFEALGGFDSTYRYAGDTDFFLRAAAAGARFAHVDEVVCVERHRAGSLSAAFQDQHREEIRRAVRSHGRTESPWERVVGDPARILRALGRQAASAAAFARAFRSSSPGRWARFLGAGYLESLSTAKLLLNVVPAPLLPRKLSVGTLRTGSWADDPEEAG